ncbi:hypothetical protein BKA70DRAFT_1411772, partial [Coprinopsis sp. MPI-PUGE-AT-0042]
MSPELMQEVVYDSKSYIWSLGLWIYNLCMLNPPFHEPMLYVSTPAPLAFYAVLLPTVVLPARISSTRVIREMTRCRVGDSSNLDALLNILVESSHGFQRFVSSTCARIEQPGEVCNVFFADAMDIQ